MPKKSTKRSKNTKQFTVKSAGGENTTAQIIVQNKVARTPLVSVILPGHNVAQFLDQCLSSVCNQTLQDIEIIYVDDGSVDNSLEIAKKFAENDRRITVVSQKNRNAGVARNAGLAIARGKYLSFLDSDDFFEPNMHETLYKRATETNADIVMCDTFLYDDQEQTDRTAEWTLRSDLANKDVFSYRDLPDDIYRLSNCWVWNRLYRAEFIRDNKILFQSLAFSNDVYFSCVTMVLASTISLTTERLVHYRVNQLAQNNVTGNNNRLKHPTESTKCFSALYKRLHDMGIYKLVKKSFLGACVENLYWTKECMATNPSSLAEFKKFFAENMARAFMDEFDFKNNTLNMKYSTLRNILIDAGIIKQIPKRIFYVWGAGEAKRPEVQKCIDTWKQFLPDYEIAELNEDNKEYFDYDHELKTNHWFKTVYSRKMWAYVADYIRIKALYEHGGIYFDTDVSVVKNMDKFLHNPAFVGMQSSSLDGYGDFVEPAICASQRGNKFFEQIVRFYDRAIWTESVYTMPRVFDHFLREYQIFPFPIKSEQQIIKLPDLTIYPERYFIPFRFRDKFSDECIESDTHTVHWWGASWVKEENAKFLNHKHLLGYMSDTGDTPCVSVIVCAYNAQDFLHKCLDSLLSQTLHNIEIICVNDGSADNTLSVLQEYASQDSRVRVIDQKNAGLSISRNNALKIARGEYIQFVDADDWLRADGLEYLYLYSKYYNLDMCCFGGVNFDLATNQFVPNPYYQFEYLPEKFQNIFNHADCKQFITRMAVSSCLTFYRKGFLDTNNIRWVNKKLCFEDNLFFTEALFKAERISILKDKIYQRTIHSGCITRNIDKNFADYLEISDRVIQLVNRLTSDPDIIEAYRNAYMGRCRSQFNGLQNKAVFYKQTAALLKKYNCSFDLNIQTAPRKTKQYVLFPYYLLACGYVRWIKIPLAKLRKYLYTHSYRGRTEMLNNNFTKILNNISALNRRHDALQKQLDDMRNFISADSKQHDKKFTDITNNLSAQCAQLGRNIDTVYDKLSHELSQFQSATLTRLGAVDKLSEQIQSNNADIDARLKHYSRLNSEPYWANVYHDTIMNSNWLANKSVSPGRWAVSYIVLYVLYRILDEVHPKSILECGLGQSSKLTIQYADNHDANLMICENNPEWAKFFARQFPTAQKYTKFLDLEMVTIVPPHESRTYAGFNQAVSGKKFDLVLVDGPWGCQHYSRPEILEIADCLADSFVIMLDDMNRTGEQETWDLLKEKLTERGIKFCEKIYASDKSVGLLCSPDLEFLTTL